MPPPQDFTITVGRHRETVTVALAGELDLAASPLLRDHLAVLREDRPDTLVLDLGDITFIDSSGVALLLATWRRAQREGFALVITRVPPAARRVLELYGVLALLPIVGERTSTSQGTPKV
jgi:anti-sigma B factor antagonist